ncbi:MAG: transcription termination factor Rho, partial [Nitriliruptoraceae bacterium]
TRRDELLRDGAELEAIWARRQAWSQMKPAEALGDLLDGFAGHEANASYLASLDSSG